jgi:hypothetical protein
MIADDSGGTERLMTFRVGRGRFAVDLDGVLGVQDPVSFAAGGGAVVFQGRRILALDARGLGWGGSVLPGAGAPAAAIIVGGGDTSPTALVVDGVDGIVAGSTIQPLPGLVAPFVRGVFCGVALDAGSGRLVVDPAALAAMAGKRADGGGRGGPGEA